KRADGRPAGHDTREAQWARGLLPLRDGPARASPAQSARRGVSQAGPAIWHGGPPKEITTRHRVEWWTAALLSRSRSKAAQLLRLCSGRWPGAALPFRAVPVLAGGLIMDAVLVEGERREVSSCRQGRHHHPTLRPSQHLRVVAREAQRGSPSLF